MKRLDDDKKGGGIKRKGKKEKKEREKKEEGKLKYKNREERNDHERRRGGGGMGVGQGRPEPETRRGTFFFLTLRRGRNDVIASNIVTGQNRYPSEYNW